MTRRKVEGPAPSLLDLLLPVPCSVREGIRRDLEVLLNTPRKDWAPAGMEHTVLTFGLPEELWKREWRIEASPHELAEWLQETWPHFEPRLTDVLVETDAGTRGQMHWTVRACLRGTAPGCEIAFRIEAVSLGHFVVKDLTRRRR